MVPWKLRQSMSSRSPTTLLKSARVDHCTVNTKKAINEWRRTEGINAKFADNGRCQTIIQMTTMAGCGLSVICRCGQVLGMVGCRTFILSICWCFCKVNKILYEQIQIMKFNILLYLTCRGFIIESPALAPQFDQRLPSRP